MLLAAARSGYARLERLAYQTARVAAIIPRVIIMISLFLDGGTGAAEVARGREADTDLPVSVGTVRRGGWARTSPRSWVVRGKTPGSYGRASPGARSYGDSGARCAARPGRCDLAVLQDREDWTAGRHRVAVKPLERAEATSGRYDASFPWNL